LTDYVTELNRSNPDSPRLFRAFQDAALTYNRLLNAKDAASRAYELSPTPGHRRRLDRALAKTEAALLRRETLRVAYQNSNQGQSSTSLVQTLSPAHKASSDRGSKLQISSSPALSRALWSDSRQLPGGPTGGDLSVRSSTEASRMGSSTVPALSATSAMRRSRGAGAPDRGGRDEHFVGVGDMAALLTLPGGAAVRCMANATSGLC
jgi:hypothetical protein